MLTREEVIKLSAPHVSNQLKMVREYALEKGKSIRDVDNLEIFLMKNLWYLQEFFFIARRYYFTKYSIIIMYNADKKPIKLI